MDKYVIIDKELGETPLEALERYRLEHEELEKVPMTYAGRLDPLATGQLLLLIGDECKNKQKYLRLDKEYEMEIVFGISTDSYDSLGIPKIHERNAATLGIEHSIAPYLKIPQPFLTFIQSYPPYSSKTILGIPLHRLARTNSLPDEMPEKQIKLYEFEVTDRYEISAEDLLARILHGISLVGGDFRQEEIGKKWIELFENSKRDFDVIKVRVSCSSGTYMRSLAHKLGIDSGLGAFALSIRRTRIFM